MTRRYLPRAMPRASSITPAWRSRAMVSSTAPDPAAASEQAASRSTMRLRNAAPRLQ